MAIHIIGTSHISKQSVREITDAIEKEKPAIVAVELDQKRLYALLHKQKSRFSLRDIQRVGIKGFLFAILGSWVQKKLGKYTGMVPGSEMLTAVQLAKKHNLHLSLIDQDIEITLKRLSGAFTWSEKWHFIRDFFKGIYFSIVKPSKLPSFDLTKVPEEKMIENLIGEIKKSYPNLYRVLIKERNEVMARKLIEIQQANTEKNILAVVGAGHKKEMEKIIKGKSSKITDGRQ
ncbi:TraB/GumN family protein [Candidatus Woesearchaeota archaeon]|nr:TraB/GumN family protein [Candidatus Woesearchaeota archaeon]